jgi:hypothetical protein
MLSWMLSCSYHSVLEQCALVQDLQLFAAGDETEVGEKVGGQFLILKNCDCLTLLCRA